MRKTDRKLDDFIQEAENSYSETVSDATTVYDAAGLKNNDYAGLFSGEEDTDAVFASEDDSVLLPSELAEQEVPKKKGNPIARFFKWIGSWKIGVKILVMRNGFLGLVREHQKKVYDGHYSGVQLFDYPHYDKIAQAYDMEYFHCDSNEDLDAKLDAFLACPGACLMVCDVDSDNVVV